MKAIKVEITNIVMYYQPDFYECRFLDARGNMHIVVEKLPVISMLDQVDQLPADGVLGCEILSSETDQDGRTIFRVTTEKPWYIESITGTMVFEVWEEQLTDI